jgi:hypothetical protein
MPILMVALIALAVFGLVGVLLLTAMLLEQRMHNKQPCASALQGSHFPLVKH